MTSFMIVNNITLCPFLDFITYNSVLMYLSTDSRNLGKVSLGE